MGNDDVMDMEHMARFLARKKHHGKGILGMLDDVREEIDHEFRESRISMSGRTNDSGRVK